MSALGSHRERGGVEVAGALVVVREQRERLRLEDRYFVVVPGELADVIERVESREGDECDLAALETAQDICAPEAGNASHRREQFAHEGLQVGVGVLWGGPASPQACDQSRRLPVDGSAREAVRWRRCRSRFPQGDSTCQRRVPERVVS